MLTLEDGTLLYLQRQDVEAISGEFDCVEVLRQVFALHGSGNTVLPAEAALRWNNGGEQLRSLGMPAYVGGSFDAAGTKVINSNPSNFERGLARADGLTLIHDTATGRIKCVMDGGYLSALRTAAVTMLAAELLGGPHLECVAIVGAGVLGEAHLALVPKYLRTATRVLLYDIRDERVAALHEKSASLVGPANLQVSIASSAESAVRAADLVVPVTTTTTPYIKYDWLKPGCLIVNVSLDDVEPEVVLTCDVLTVDDWNLVRQDDKRLMGRMIRAGQVTGPRENGERPSARPIDAELGDLVVGTKRGRRGPDDIILVNPFGLAIEDVALGARIFQIAMRDGRGTRLQR